MNPDKGNEIIAVVDKHGKPIKYIKRRDIKDSYTWRLISVWVENDKGEVLLQQRSFKKRLGPGLWTCAVEGTVEGDDDFDTTAQREVEEEIGLTNATLQKTNQVLYKAELGSRLAQGYVVRCNWAINEFTPQKEEVEKLKWIDRDEVIALIKKGDPMFPLAAKAWLDMFNLV